ncbi:MAG: RidA family protein [Gemmatimonadota bacterium]|nr:RidA family protein [Gemmatimonadota bacterium]MDQ8146561.1 RidA family protein [Gemmatimonadota bacterium]MDQ8148486.1 RidA family protein [Gemmatimonadota bacterium]MDQ8156375.1 RidA family protein [Gemmatimonadota bacterium]MDQ8175915.1 RidA family protein [Gemmatimonadota bacterium]
MTLRILHPESWAPPKGYANGVLATGRQIHVAGQIGWDAEQRIVPGGLVPQTRQALENIVAVLASGGARPEHLVRLTWYLTDRAAYLAASKELGAVYRDVIGRHFPAMTAVEVSALMEAEAVVEIEATAIIP